MQIRNHDDPDPYPRFPNGSDPDSAQNPVFCRKLSWIFASFGCILNYYKQPVLHLSSEGNKKSVKKKRMKMIINFYFNIELQFNAWIRTTGTVGRIRLPIQQLEEYPRIRRVRIRTRIRIRNSGCESDELTRKSCQSPLCFDLHNVADPICKSVKLDILLIFSSSRGYRVTAQSIIPGEFT